jgi:hypothetical protein
MRATKLNAALTKRICRLLEEGSTIAGAATRCGIGPRTFHDWITRGEADEKPFKAFLVAVSRAREKWRDRLLSRVTASPDWRAAAFLLERQFPREFGLVRRVERRDGADDDRGSADSYSMPLPHGIRVEIVHSPGEAEIERECANAPVITLPATQVPHDQDGARA